MLESFFFAKNIDEHVTTVIGFSDACDCLIGNYNVARYMTFSVNTLKKTNKKQLYDDGLMIKGAHYGDLMKKLQEYIEPIHHDFLSTTRF